MIRHITLPDTKTVRITPIMIHGVVTKADRFCSRPSDGVSIRRMADKDLSLMHALKCPEHIPSRAIGGNTGIRNTSDRDITVDAK